MSKRITFFTFGAVTLAIIATRTLLSEPKRTAEKEDHEISSKIPHHGLGREATTQDFAKRGYLVGPKGSGLPKGHGTAKEGRAIYLQSCAACHGQHGEGTNDYPALVGGKGSLATDKPFPTVGSYWPYATTVWDYVNRAMPYTSPGTLKPDEVYAVTAYLLALNGIVPEFFELNEKTLADVKMPNRDGFVPDPRPDVK
jgi:S-disulfanyl-L-cysteine oxidoreductase SoxD